MVIFDSNEYLAEVKVCCDKAEKHFNEHCIRKDQHNLDQAFRQASYAFQMMYFREEQPLRTIVFLLAARIALRCDFFKIAQMLAEAGLLENPPEEAVPVLEEVIRFCNNNK